MTWMIVNQQTAPCLPTKPASLPMFTSMKMPSLTASTLAPPLSTKPPPDCHRYPPQAAAIKPRVHVDGRGRKFRHLTASSQASAPSSPGLYSSEKFELTIENVDLVLEDVRPYLISDGGNVDVVSVDDGVISLKLQGACESCPSSTTTMKMGIERVLKEKFGDAVKDIQQVYDEQPREITVEAVNRHLDILRPAIKNFGGSVEVLAIESGDCKVQYTGPESIGSGIKAAIKEKFPDIINVVFVS